VIYFGLIVYPLSCVHPFSSVPLVAKEVFESWLVLFYRACGICKWVSVLNVFNSALYVLCIIITVTMIDFVCNLDHQGWKSH